MNNKVKFMYLRDEKTPRVVTVAREVTHMEEGTSISYAWAVNAVAADDGWRPLPPNAGRVGTKMFYGDAFDKKLGRKIAEGRLRTAAYGFYIHNKEKPVAAGLIEHIAGNKDAPRCVREIAQRALDTFAAEDK